MNYYNEWDKKKVAWIRELIKARLIPNGEVDERSIEEIKPSELAEYTQCHFFAGIAGWSFALRIAGWPANRPVWTASCPCQPYSLGGKNEGTRDSRDLWPIFARFIPVCKPPVVFGEQVEAAIRWGWLDRLCDDMEAADYACGASVLPACSKGFPHVRSRIFWTARSNANGMRSQRLRPAPQEPWSRQQFEGLVQAVLRSAVPSGTSGGLSDGVPARVVRLCGYGDAIVPQAAAEFIQAAEESLVSC